MPGGHRVGHAQGRRRLAPVLPRRRRRPRRRHDALRGLPRHLRQSGRPVVAAAGRCRRTGGIERLGIITGSSPIATQVPHAAGIAYAIKYRNEDAVVGCWFGDGATSEGDWHEGLNFAGIHRLPVIFVCENNRYAISVPQSKQMAIDDVADRAAGYGFPGVVVDGNDVLACYGAMKEAHERARAGEGPTLIECKTYRFLGHTSDDDDKTYRPRDEVEEARHTIRSTCSASTCGRNGSSTTSAPRSCARRSRARSTRPSRRHGTPQTQTPASALRHVFARTVDPRPDAAAAPDREERRHGDPRRAARRDGGRRPGRPARRGRREPWRRLPHQRRLDGGVRGAARDRHAARRSRASSEWRSAWRCEGCCRWPRSSSPTSSIRRSTRSCQKPRASATARTVRSVSLGDPGPVRRRHPRRALPLAVDRGVLRPRAGTQGRHAGHAGRRGRTAPERDAPTPTRCCSSSTRRPTERSQGRTRRAVTCPDRHGRCEARGHRPHVRQLRVLAAHVPRRRGQAAGGRGRLGRSRRRALLAPLDTETILRPCTAPRRR